MVVLGWSYIWRAEEFKQKGFQWSSNASIVFTVLTLILIVDLYSRTHLVNGISIQPATPS